MGKRIKRPDLWDKRDFSYSEDVQIEKLKDWRAGFHKRNKKPKGGEIKYSVLIAGIRKAVSK